MSDPARLELSPLRRAIASRMVEAKTTIPHYRLTSQIRVDRLLEYRAKLNAGLSTDLRVSINDCIIKATAHSLAEHPELNCNFVDGNVLLFDEVDISVIAKVPGGLSTPVVRNAQAKGIHRIAEETKKFAALAAAGRLRMDDIIGGTFSVSNLGNWGVDSFDAIINPPQCGIVAVGQVSARTFVSSGGEVEVGNGMTLTLSLDHRVIDGDVGATFLHTLRAALENPAPILFNEGRQP